jgi:hypothetical protein
MIRNRNKNRNKFINQIRATGGHIKITIMIDTQQQYIKLNIRGEISIIVLQAHSGNLFLFLFLFRIISKYDDCNIHSSTPCDKYDYRVHGIFK